MPATEIQSTLQSLKWLSEEPSLTLESADFLEGQKALIWKGSLSRVSKVRVAAAMSTNIPCDSQCERWHVGVLNVLDPAFSRLLWGHVTSCTLTVMAKQTRAIATVIDDGALDWLPAVIPVVFLV